MPLHVHAHTHGAPNVHTYFEAHMYYGHEHLIDAKLLIDDIAGFRVRWEERRRGALVCLWPSAERPDNTKKNEANKASRVLLPEVI